MYEEVAYMALNAHWSLTDILDLEHTERRRWVAEIQKARQQMA
ncbi:DUF6760 family protein [Microcoleus sp. FACHB-SPT15]|nr:DUF6760 family protein [Microcoleus sp. FACHB-SPT15]